MNKCLHIITVEFERKNKIRNFYSKVVCHQCGTNEKYFLTWSTHDCLCASCYPNCMDVLSRSTIFIDEKKKNAIKKKAKKDNWSIPEVYGGYNTCK